MGNRKRSEEERKLNMKDIARMAGVSVTTVSNVIHGNTDRASEKTVSRVEKILAEYGYKPSVSAVMLAGKRSKMIGVLISDVLGKTKYLGNLGTMIRKIEKKIYEQGDYMLLHFSDLAEENLEFLNGWKMDGVLTMGISDEEKQKICQKYDRPLVSVDIDAFQAGYLMGLYLEKCGYRKCGYFAESIEWTDTEKWLGLKANFVEKEYILIPSEKEKRREFYKKNLARFAFSKEVLVFASDYYAAEAIGYLHDMEIKIPEEISVAGLGGEEYAEVCRPVLTTIRMAGGIEETVDNLFAMIHGGEKEENNIKIELVEGESVIGDVAQRKGT